MKISPLAPALWLTSVIVLAANLVLYVAGIPFMDPIISVMFFLLAQELSKLVAEITMENDDGTDSNS
jgi:Co/Zn/Cd efflux system component